MESIIIPHHSKECGWHTDWHTCNCGMFDILAYAEPGNHGEIITKRISVEEAIIKQVSHAKALGQTYTTQEEALQDFIANNWAWIERI